MPTPEQIETVVRRYVDLAARGSGSEIAALYAPDATVEDPVGTPPHVGRDAIAAFYESVRGQDREIELLTLRIAGATAAFHFRVTSKAGESAVVVEPIDVMTFDDDARITSMRAIWSPQDLTTQ